MVPRATPIHRKLECTGCGFLNNREEKVCVDCGCSLVDVNIKVPEMVSVVSSNLAEVAWESGDMYVRFKNGGLYVYREVPEHVYESFHGASSKGKYLGGRIIPNYRADRLL